MKCRATKPKSTIIRALSLSAVFALTLQLASVRAADEPHPEPPATTTAAASPPAAATPPAAASVPAAPSVTTTASVPVRTRFLPLGVGKSVIIDLPRDVKDVLVADPKIANAVIRSSQRAYIIGTGIGQTNVVFFDADGQQIASYDIAIKRDLNGVRAALHQILPSAAIQAEGIGDSVML